MVWGIFLFQVSYKLCPNIWRNNISEYYCSQIEIVILYGPLGHTYLKLFFFFCLLSISYSRRNGFLLQTQEASCHSSSSDITHEASALFVFSVVNSFPSHASPWWISQIFLSIPSWRKGWMNSFLILKLIRS